MKKFIFPALICSIPTFIISLTGIIFYEKILLHPAISYVLALANIIILFLFFMYFLKKYKFSYNSGIISFGKAFKYLFKISILFALFSSIAALAEYSNTDMIKKTKAHAIEIQQEQLISTTGSISASQQKLIESNASYDANPYVMSVAGLFSLLILGTILSLIVAAIYKTKPVE